MELLSFKAETKNIEMKGHVESRFPRTIKTDAIRLKQILINLISNAIKYTEQGYVKVEAKVVN